jgi:hypothetical protein
MARCEDFPCCGHVLNECPTGPAKPCPDCGRMFEPCSLGEEYCLACGQRPRMPKFDMAPMAAIDGLPIYGTCVECENCHEEDRGPVPLYWARYGKRHENLCQDCADAYGQAAADDAYDLQSGDYD